MYFQCLERNESLRSLDPGWSHCPGLHSYSECLLLSYYRSLSLLPPPPPFLRPRLFQRLKEMKLKAQNHFSILKVPNIHINISKGPPGCRNQSRIPALRQIQKIQPTIIYFEAAASSISALSESNQSNSKLYPQKWASGIDSKGQWLPAIIESKWQRVQLFSFCSILTNDPVLMEATQGQW